MENDKLKPNKSWQTIGFDKNLQRPIEGIKTTGYLPGNEFDVQLDQLAFNRVIRFKNLDRQPQGNYDTGKTYYDNTTGKVKIWVGGAAKWADLVVTTTSTSTTSTSTTSTSTSTTSTSTTSTSSSTTSTSTTSTSTTT